MNDKRRMWRTIVVALLLLTVVVGQQIVVPLGALSSVTFHRTFRLQRIESGLLNGTPTVDIVTTEREIQWKVEDRECTWQGHSYDVLRIDRSGGTIHLVAISDEEEDEAELSIQTASALEHRSLGTVDRILAAFLLCPIHADSGDLDTVMHTPTAILPPVGRESVVVEGWRGDVPTPPPWTWSTT